MFFKLRKEYEYSEIYELPLTKKNELNKIWAFKN